MTPAARSGGPDAGRYRCADDQARAEGDTKSLGNFPSRGNTPDGFTLSREAGRHRTAKDCSLQGWNAQAGPALLRSAEAKAPPAGAAISP